MRTLSPSGRHAAVVVVSFALMFGWLYARPVLTPAFFADSDLYEYFLPLFLAPITTWSSYEFGGMPAFADPQDTAFYPLHLLFARVIGSWTAFVVSAYVMASCFTYAYVYSVTRSRLAAAVAGLAFGLSEAMMERISHMTTIHAAAWLPLMLLAIDRLRGPRPTLWVAIGAFAIGSCVLGGHPQVVLYALYACGLYALCGGLAERAGWPYYARLTVALALGAGLTAIKAIPLVETSALTARQSTSFAQFVGHANTPAQMLSAFFPTILHEGREAPTYVGVATLVFALTAAWRLFRDWRVAFWLVVGGITLLIGAGDATPFGALAYHVPLYDRFRVAARHLILASFALTALAGFGVACVQRGEASRRALASALGLVCLGFVAGAAVIVQRPDTFAIEDHRELPWALPVLPASVWLQLTIALASAVVCLGVARWPRSRSWGLALLLGLGVDLLAALPYDLRATGLEATVIPADAARHPSVHASRLAEIAKAQHQRMLAPSGTQLDDVVPAAFARVWQIPIAGGYGPMLLARHARLAMMATNGSVDPLVLSDDNAALDVLAVRYVVMNENDFAAPGAFEQDGVTWSSRTLGLSVGPAECGQRHPRSASYALPAGVIAQRLMMVAHLRCSEDVPQGTAVATLTLIGPAGERSQRTLLAGVDIAEAELGDPRLRRRAKHTTARIFETGEPQLTYLIEFDLPRSIAAPQLQIDVAGTPGWLEVDRVSVVTPSGLSVPQDTPAALFNAGRWREAARFATSRLTDRGTDEEGDEQRYVVFENRRARPRAWVAQEVLPLEDKETLTALHHGHLPDGRLFDPARTALVELGRSSAASYTATPSTAAVRGIRDGAITVDVTTEEGGFLVLSESFYPGWRARIGSVILTIQRTDYSLQGVAVPPGHHVVEFEFVSGTKRIGAAVSALALALVALVGWRATRQTRLQ